jgi:hypothetical protein
MARDPETRKKLDEINNRLKPLSEEAKDMRKPMPPDWYVGATNESVHIEFTSKSLLTNRVES